MRALSRGSSETLRELVANDAPDGNFDGYNFWLNKLDAFEVNFIDAEMVKAFIESAEYRQRFVQ